MAIKISNTTVIDDSRNLTNIENVGVSGVSTISVNSSSDALRITQLGSGNALVVEDETNPDSTPFVVNASGSVGVGTTAPAYSVHIEDNLSTSGGIFVESNSITLSSPIVRVRGVRSDTNTSQCFSGQLVLEKYQINGATSSGRNLGAIIFGGNYSTTPGITTGITYGASIGAMADGTFSGINTAPTAIVFNTGSVGLGTLGLANVNYGTEAARITSNRNLLIGSSSETGTASQTLQVTGGAYVSDSVGIGTTNPGARLDVTNDATTNFTAIFGADSNASTRTNATEKATRIAIPHYTSSEEPAALLFAQSGSSFNTLTFGGGTSLMNATNFIDFYTASNNTTTSGTRALRIDSSQRVGIGTDVLSARLNVVPASNAPAGLFSGTTSDDMVRITQLGSGNALVVEDSANPDTTPFVVTGIGSVGIGTTNPTSKLQVQGTIGLGASDDIESNFPGGRTKLTSSASGLIINHNDNSAIIVQSQGAERVRVGAAGSVGIGTNNPSTLLDVFGSTITLGDNSTGGAGITRRNTNSSLSLNGGSSGANIELYGSTHASVADNAYYDARTHTFRNAGGAGGYVAITTSTSQFNNVVLIGSATSTGTESQTLQVTGGGYVSGSVGIGTTNPTVKLDVVGGSMRIVATGYPAATYGTNVGRIQFGYQDAFDGAELSASTNAGAGKKLYLNATGNGPVLINTFTETGTASQALQVSGGAYVSGSVGIGTTIPTSKLHVIGDTLVTGVSTIVANSSTEAFRITQLGTGNALVVEDSTNPDATPFVVNADGSVGIGTTNPGTTLDVRGEVWIGGVSSILRWRTGSTEYATARIFGNDLAFEVASAERLRLTSAGNIGIGLTNPSAALTIATAGIASDGRSQIYLNGTTSNRIDFSQAGVAGPAIIGTSGTTRSVGTKIVLNPGSAAAADYAFGIQTNTLWSSVPSSSQSYLWYAGTVGIATLSGTGALSVTGGIVGTTVDLTGVGIASDGNSQIYLNGATSNRIDFNTNGLAAPSTVGTSGTTRSIGTKIVLYPSATNDYAFGMESSHIWSSIPSGALGWKWYGGNVGVATLSVAGALSLSGGLTIGTNSNIVADFSNATLTSRSYFITNTTNGSTVVGAIPNGTNATTGFLAFNNSTPTNATYCGVVAGATGGFLRVATTGTGAYLPLNIETNNVTQVAISTGGEVTFTKGITVSAGIATIPTVSVTATTASTSTTTGALTVAGGVGVAASVHAGGDVDGRRFGSNTATVTMSGTPANIATIAATGAVGLVTFATAGIAATVNVTGMIAGQVLNLFITNPTTAKVLTIQYNGTAIAGSGIATASPAQGTSFALNTTKYYRFMAMTDGVPVAGDIRVAAV
jgi:hypothetical protein